MWINQRELDTFRNQGCKVILNPRKDYYPEYDQDLNKSLSMPGMIDTDSPDSLPVEEL